jgi:hypothetical protein
MTKELIGYAGGRVLDVPRAKSMCVLSVGMNLSTLHCNKSKVGGRSCRNVYN